MLHSSYLVISSSILILTNIYTYLDQGKEETVYSKLGIEEKTEIAFTLDFWMTVLFVTVFNNFVF